MAEMASYPRGYHLLPNPPAQHQHDREALATYTSKKRHLRIWKSISELTSLTLNIVILGLMLYVQLSFYFSRDRLASPAPPTSDGQSTQQRLWPRDPTLWPSYMMLAAALVMLGFSITSLVLNCRGGKGKPGGEVEKREKRKAKWISTAKYVFMIGFWIGVAVLYRVGKKERDLWGWSCMERVKKFRQESEGAVYGYAGKVNFERLCQAQGDSWYVAIALVVLRVILAIGDLYFGRKIKKEKRRLGVM